MLTQIKNWLTGAVIFECECELDSESLRLGFAVKAAIKAKADLQSADLHSADLRYADLRYANLRYANLRYADLQYANLRYAILQSANLQSADLRYANLRYAKGITDYFPLPEGVTLGQFKAEIVPQLLTAGGKTVAEVVASGCWDCHEWANGPMHVALGISTENEAPLLLRPWVSRFLQLFDSMLLECPVIGDSPNGSADAS